jgi:hypothetical protein
MLRRYPYYLSLCLVLKIIPIISLWVDIPTVFLRFLLDSRRAECERLTASKDESPSVG